jgi:hypothetical protein
MKQIFLLDYFYQDTFMMFLLILLFIVFVGTIIGFTVKEFKRK